MRGTCSSRIVVNVPKAHSLGVEAELFARPNENWDFGVSATWVEARIDTTVTGTGTTPIAGIEDGNRMPTAPELQAAASVTYSWPWGSTLRRLCHLHRAARGLLVHAARGPGAAVRQLISGRMRFITFGNPTISSFAFPTELPSYEIGNLRARRAG